MEKKVIPFKGIRKIIAERMRFSLDTAAQANHRLRVDMTNVLGIREDLNKISPRKISVTDIIIKAVAQSLVQHPTMNSKLTEEGIVAGGEVNIGFAVAVEGGLVVPVVRDCDSKGLLEISTAVGELAKKAKNRRLLPDDMNGGSFTVSNLGMYGIENFTAIINTPEVGILAVGTIVKTPVVDDSDCIVVRPLMEISLTYDHRVVDGAPAAMFLQSIKKSLEAGQFKL